MVKTCCHKWHFSREEKKKNKTWTPFSLWTVANHMRIWKDIWMKKKKKDTNDFYSWNLVIVTCAVIDWCIYKLWNTPYYVCIYYIRNTHAKLYNDWATSRRSKTRSHLYGMRMRLPRFRTQTYYKCLQRILSLRTYYVLSV